MKEEKHTFGAGEVGKFTYCPLQWYYTRTYGWARLREMYREQNPNKTNRANENFRRGNAFHKTYRRRENTKRAVFWVVILLFALLCVILWRNIYRLW